MRQTDWFASYVETARDLGIVSGYPDGRFQPSRQVTYGEFLAMAMRGKALPDGGSGVSEDPYKIHWARKFYDAAVAAADAKMARVNAAWSEIRDARGLK